MILFGKSINLRTVEFKDADFIYLMRQDKKAKYLSKINGTVKNQIDWIKEYKKREEERKEFYFVIESKEGDSYGLVRMYDFKQNSFCWGSWIIKDDAPKSTAIESVIQIYEFGFKTLGFDKSHFDVRKDNDKVIAFHKRFGAEIVSEDELNYYFCLDKKDYENIKLKYKRYLL
ncbi:GNAT family N-acetyltransferase [Thermodesulfobium sp. 4217-1]|uniref:GNAT family N-acetyltransferase n=1 Tax=Thermodesulfobium sp. 4217-1 TaxID=3120013 RepID=UPI003221A30C